MWCPMTSWLNYHHLFYFWTVVREGGVSRAAEKLRLSQPTISAQIKPLEDALGQRLFRAPGRDARAHRRRPGRLSLRRGHFRGSAASCSRRSSGARRAGAAADGRRGQRGAEAGRLPAAAARRRAARPCRSRASKAIPSSCSRGWRRTRSMSCISDTPAPPHVRVQGVQSSPRRIGHLVLRGDGAGAPARGRFPQSLNGAPMLLPTITTSVRRALEEWFDAEGLRPVVAGEFDDPALLNTFGERGRAVFAAPTAIEARGAAAGRRVAVVGRTSVVRERYYAISVERRLKHAGVAAITSAARTEMFGEKKG